MLLKEKFEIHDTLNPKLWFNNKLKDDVKQKIVQIVEQFVSTCDVPLHIVDVHIVGSQASYNYTQYSDLDVHIISNFELVDCSKEILQVAYNSVKTKFNSDYDITIKDIDVELYVEDVKSSVTSNGIYSLYEDSWIKFPKKLTNVPNVDVSDEVSLWTTKINNAISSNDSERIEKIIDDLYLERQSSLYSDGEYGKGNQLFKEIRNLGLLDRLKDSYKSSRSKELSLESLQMLHEDSRSSLLAKSKKSDKGFQRFKKRVKSRVANSVKQYNSIDMNKLFKKDILTVDIQVKGETDTYTVKISFGGFCELLQDQIKKQDGKLDFKAVTRALILGFNKDDVFIHCSCPDATYRMNYWQTKNGITSGEPETRPSDITNPDDTLGSACKHVLLVLSNTSWLLKVGSTILNYIRYMEKHYEKLYADIIYPAVYGKDYEEPVQLDIFDDDSLETDTDTIDKSNEYARTKNQFKQGNKEGIRFASKNNDQQSFDIEDSPIETPVNQSTMDDNV